MQVISWLGNNIALALFIAFVFLAAVAAVIKLFRRFSTWDDANKGIWDAIEEVIATLRRLTENALHSLSEQEVSDTAGIVYDTAIAPTIAARFITRPAFIAAVVSRWRLLANVERSTRCAAAQAIRRKAVV
jgi:hypothetical protein